MQILNESFVASIIEIVSIRSFVCRYRIELDSDINIQHQQISFIMLRARRASLYAALWTNPLTCMNLLGFLAISIDEAKK